MFVVEAIGYVIKKIDKQLAGHLGIADIMVADPELALANLVKSGASSLFELTEDIDDLGLGDDVQEAEQPADGDGVAAVATVPAEGEKDKKKKKKSKGNAADKVQAAAPAPQVAASTTTTASAPAQPATRYTLSKWSDLKKPNSVLLQMVLPQQEVVDKIQVRHGGTWSALLLLSDDAFKAKLTDVYKDNLTLKKMLVLARYKRNLLLVNELAKKILKQNEDAQQPLSGVDEWLVSVVTDMANDTMGILGYIRQTTTTTVSVPGLTITVQNNEAESETLVLTSAAMLLKFHAFCKNQNSSRGKAVGDPLSMVDALPKHQDPNSEHPLSMINREVALYIIKNLFQHVHTSVQQERGTWFSLTRPWDVLTYLTADQRTGDEKCKHFAAALGDFDRAVFNKSVSDTQYWVSLFERLHVQHEAGVTLGRSMLPGLNAYKKQNLGDTYDRIHFNLCRLRAVPANIADGHQHCVKEADVWQPPKFT